MRTPDRSAQRALIADLLWERHPRTAEDVADMALAILQPELLLAELIARRAHVGQREASTGDDYIRHVERVVALVDGDEAKAVAWLHDVVEDCPGYPLQRLDVEGVSARTRKAVEVLTRQPGESYKAYIRAIVDAGDPLAVAVKLADLRDHLRPNCPPSLRPRYTFALETLTGGRRGSSPRSR